MKPLTPPSARTLQTLARGLDEYDEAWAGRKRTLPESQEARAWLRELMQFWPDLAHVEPGNDAFSQHPIAGVPDPVAK